MPTRIEWCDETLNPLGHGCYGPGGTSDDPRVCEYCYARLLAKRNRSRCEMCRQFVPHTHIERLDKLQQWKKPRNIFMQSMGDLFHDAVPDEWIRSVFEACEAAPQHRYLFLTKNPDRYYQLGEGDESIIPDSGISGWFGASATTEKQAQDAYGNLNCTWMSLEPLHGDFSEEFFSHAALVGDGQFDEVRRWHWIVIGAESGNRKGKVTPKREWIDNIVEQCREVETPVFMKNSLIPIMGEDNMIREFPWEDER